MVHRDNAIKLLSLDENGVAWKWALNIDTAFESCLNGWTDVIYLLPPKRAVLAVVRVQCADTQARRLNPRLPPDRMLARDGREWFIQKHT
jgi:hypothetical protein